MPLRNQTKDTQPAMAWDDWASGTGEKSKCLGGAYRRWPLQTQGRVARGHSGKTIARDIFGRY